MEDSSLKKGLSNRNSFQKDFLWYFLGSFVPLSIGFIKTPIFTRHFSAEQFGNLGIISISYTFFGMILFSWIGSCIWRYYHRYKEERRLGALFSNLGFLYLLSFMLLGLISVLWYGISKSDLNKELIMYSFFQLALNQLFLFYMVVIRLMGKARFYTIFQSARALLGLIIALSFVFYFKFNIVALISSLAIVDGVSILVIMAFNPARIKISYHKVRAKELKELMRYGSMGLILNLSLLAISYSDRYVIALFYDMQSVGIYDQVYKISQLSVMALVTIYFNTINPVLLKVLETNFDKSLTYINRYLFSFILFGLPIVFYLTIFSKDISTILLGKEFRGAYTLMPFVFAASFLHGISNFFELRLKFSDQLKKLGLIALSTAMLNMILNLIMVRLYGFEWAAYATLISYVFMIVLFYYWDSKVFDGILTKRKELLKIIGLLTIQYLIYVVLVDKLETNLGIRIAIGLIFVLMFFIIFRKHILHLKLPDN